MSLMNRIRKASQQTKIFRYKTYKKIGCVGYRKKVDRIIMSLMVVLLIVGAFFIIKRDTSTVDSLNCAPDCPIEPVINEEAQEVVHSDLGDEPVIEEENPELTLNDLENRVRQNTAKVKTLSLNKNESFAALLARANLAKVNQTGVLETMTTLMDIKTLKKGTTVIFFFDKKTDSFLGLSVGLDHQEFIAVIKNENGEFNASFQEGVKRRI